MTRGQNLLVMFGLLTLCATAGAAPLHVGKVTIHAGALFDDGDLASRAFYRVVNRLHVQTRERLIRRFLLFREGDAFDEARLRESERNLRALDFLSSAAISTGQPHEGIVDVIVTTEDAFTTDANIDFSNDGGRSLYDIDLSQKDLLGIGTETDLRVATARERTTRSFELLHPALFGPYWAGDALLAKSSDGNEEKFTITRPLFSTTERYTADGSFDHLLQDGRTYERGVVANLFRQEHRQVALHYGRVIASGEQTALRTIVGADLLSDAFQVRQGTAPDDRRYHFAEAGLDSTTFRFLKLDHVDLGLREQDFNVGTHVSIFAAVSPASASRRSVFRVRTEDSVGRAFGGHAFLISRLTATSRFRDLHRNQIISLDTQFVDRMRFHYPATIAIRVRADVGIDVDRDVQFFADGQNGLRAYPNFAFSGTHRLLFNAEQRVFLGREWLHIFEPGVAVFVDSGEAMRREGFAFRRLQTDAGAGVRIGIARYESAMIRIDAAYAFNGSPLSTRGLVFSIATTQVF